MPDLSQQEKECSGSYWWIHATELDKASCKLITFISEWDNIAVAIYHKGYLAVNDVFAHGDWMASCT